MKKYSQAETSVILLVLVFGLSVLLGGCTVLNKDKTAEDDNGEEGVLWARECGQDGLRCCADEDQACFYGQECCVNPRDESENRCADDCSCGKDGNYCCASEPGCGEGLACYLDFCTSCGGVQDPCCPGDNACGDELVCHQGLCVECGLPGNPCCEAELECSNQGQTNKLRTECINELCIYCGSGNKISCPNEPVCNTGHLLNNNYCLKCGLENQPCCKEEAGVEYKCSPELDLECQLGFCTEK